MLSNPVLLLSLSQIAALMIHWVRRAPGLPAGLVFLAVLVLTGCLPHSCQREPSQALYPSDSLSRRVARDTPADTLERVWTTAGTEEAPLEHPRTVRFLDDSRLAVSDVKRNSLFLFGPDGALRRELDDPSFAVPYLIGTRGDTLVVFNADTDRIDFVTVDGSGSRRSISYDRPGSKTLVYMVATQSALYAKTVGRDIDPFVARLDSEGRPTARIHLTGPYWRNAGFLRLWGDSLVSLSGFRPVVDLLPRSFEDGATADSLALLGFNSPMLERSYAFGQGEVTKAPLLTPTAAAAGNTLFVLNLRPGWIQIDAYNRQGRLQRRLIEPHESGNPNFYPLDLDVRRTERGYLFAVTIRSPEPQLELYQWSPPSLAMGRDVTE